jgi:hypothetical protein
MPNEPILVNYKELAELMVKKRSIHEGLWGVYIRFGLRAANMNIQQEDMSIHLLPTAILPILEIGIQPFSNATDLTVDAATVNPKPSSQKGARPSRKTAKKK